MGESVPHEIVVSELKLREHESNIYYGSFIGVLLFAFLCLIEAFGSWKTPSLLAITFFVAFVMAFFAIRRSIYTVRRKRRKKYIETFGEDGFNEIYDSVEQYCRYQ